MLYTTVLILNYLGLKMNIAELKAVLEEYPDDLLVLVDGYESGYDDPIIHKSHCKPKIKENPWHWQGWYDELDKYDLEDYKGNLEDYKGIVLDCLVIAR